MAGEGIANISSIVDVNNLSNLIGIDGIIFFIIGFAIGWAANIIYNTLFGEGGDLGGD